MNKMIAGFVDINRLMTKAEYARTIGKSRGWVTQLAKNDLIPTVKIRGGELILVDAKK